MIEINRINKLDIFNNVFYYEMSLVCSLFPFIYTTIYSNYIDIQCISFIIIINGGLCHGTLAISHKYKMIFMYHDIICNTIFGIYVLYNTLWQPYTQYMAIILVITFLINKIIGDCWLTIVSHILFIQWSTAIILLNYSSA